MTTAISVFILFSPFFLYEFFFELVGSTKTRVSVLFRSNGCNFWCYFVKNTATIPRGQNYLRKFFRFCAPACKTNIYSLRGRRECCVRRNLILGGGALKTSGEASRPRDFARHSLRGSALDYSSRQLRRLINNLPFHINSFKYILAPPRTQCCFALRTNVQGEALNIDPRGRRGGGRDDSPLTDTMS